MASKRKLNQIVSLTHFGFTSKKVALRDKEAPKDNAGAASTVGPLAPRTDNPLPPSYSPEESEVEAKCSKDTAGAERMLAATAEMCSEKQVGEQKDRNLWHNIMAGKLGCLVCREAKTLLLSEKGPRLHPTEEWVNGDVTSSEAKRLLKKIHRHRDSQAHTSSVEISQVKEKDTLPNTFIDIQSNLLKKTTVLFRTAYTVAKVRLSY